MSGPLGRSPPATSGGGGGGSGTLEEDYAQTVSLLRVTGQAKHMNGDYRGAYNDFRRAARMNPSDRLVWEEYTKAFRDFQQQQLEDKEKESILTQASSAVTWTGVSRTYDSEMLAAASEAIVNGQQEPSSSSSRPLVPMALASRDSNWRQQDREKRRQWQRGKVHRISYAMWLVVIAATVFHYADGWIHGKDFDPLIPLLTLWILCCSLLLLWNFGMHFAAPTTTTTKAFSAFALTVITVIHWVSFLDTRNQTS